MSAGIRHGLSVWRCMVSTNQESRLFNHLIIIINKGQGIVQSLSIGKTSYFIDRHLEHGQHRF